MQRIGSRAQVMHGNAKMTGGGLKKKDLKYNKQGKIVSKKMSAMAKKEKRLQKAGYTTKKGQFGGSFKSMFTKSKLTELKNIAFNMSQYKNYIINIIMNKKRNLIACFFGLFEYNGTTFELFSDKLKKTIKNRGKNTDVFNNNEMENFYNYFTFFCNLYQFKEINYSYNDFKKKRLDFL